MRKSDSDKHFLKLSQQELKEKEFEVDPENPGDYIPPPGPDPIPHRPHSIASLKAWLPFSLRGSTSPLWSWLSAGLLQPTGGHESSPKTPYFQLLRKSNLATLGPHVYLGTIGWSQATAALLAPDPTASYCRTPEPLCSLCYLPDPSLRILVATTHRSGWGTLSPSVSSSALNQ